MTGMLFKGNLASLSEILKQISTSRKSSIVFVPLRLGWFFLNHLGSCLTEFHLCEVDVDQ